MIRMVLTSALMLLVLTSTAVSQLVYEIAGTGTRAQGMGNAFIAVSNDASAASWNPAGLTVHDKLLMGLDFDRFSPDNKFNINVEGLKQSYSNNPSFSSLSQLSIVAPFRFRGRPMVMGLSYGRGLEEFWNDGIRDSSEYVNYANLGFRDTSYVTTQRISAEHSNLAMLNVAIGTKLTQNVSGGVGINIYTGKSVSNVLVTQVIPHFTKDVIYPQYVYQEATTETIDTAKYSGTNFTFGVKYEGEKFDFGAILRTGFDLRAESDTKVNNRTVENGLLQRLGSDTVYFDNQLVKTGVPATLGFGVAARPREGLTLAVDYEYRGFSGKELKVRDSIHIRPGSDNEEFYTIYNLEFENTSSFRIGGEYEWRTPWESFPVIPFRLGFSTVTIPFTRLSVEDPNNPQPLARLDGGSIKRLHAGLGIKWSQIHLDVAATWSSGDIPMNWYLGETPIPGSYIDSNWDYSTTNLVFGFTGYF